MDETYRMLGREQARKRSPAGPAVPRGVRWGLLVVAGTVSAGALWATSAAAATSCTEPPAGPDLIERWVAAHPQATIARTAPEFPDLIERWLARRR